MSSPAHPNPVAGKLDVRKYLLILQRRKWWGIVPFVILGLVFTVIYFALPAKYLSVCVIKASSEVAELYGPRQTAKKTSEEIVNEEILRYDRVMGALVKTTILEQIEEKSKDDPILRGRLEEKLHQNIVRNTQIRAIGSTLMRVSYLGGTPDNTLIILDKLIAHFVENALRKEREDAKAARDLATAELKRAKEELDSAESTLVTFRSQHPGITETGEGGKGEELTRLTMDIKVLDREIDAQRKKLERCTNQLENTPARTTEGIKTAPDQTVATLKAHMADLRNSLAVALKTYTPRYPAVIELEKRIQATEGQLNQAMKEANQDETMLTVNRAREQLEEKKLELEAELDYRTEERRLLIDRRTKLAQEVDALPNLQKDASQFMRDVAAAANRYATAHTNFKRIDEDYSIKMEGLVSFSIVSPPRLPHEKDIRHKLRLAIIGLLISLAAAIGAITGIEFLDQSLTDTETARDFLRLPSIGVIPFIETRYGRRNRLLKYAAVAAIIVTLLAAAMLAVMIEGPIQRAAQELWHQIQERCKDLV